MGGGNHRKTTELRKGRISAIGATYFVTFNTKNRIRCLADIKSFQSGKDRIEKLSKGGGCKTISFMLMPDHVHWLFSLRSETGIGSMVRQMKFSLRISNPKVFQWQDNFFDRRIRADESVEAYALYMFLNPYRAGLIGPDERWPHYLLDSKPPFPFEAKLREGGFPYPEWIDKVKDPLLF